MRLDLPTLAEMQATPRAIPKHALKTKLDRAVDKKKARLEDARKLLAWARQVKDLDKWRDRKTGKRLTRTRDLDPLRAEAHHIASKDDWAVRYDIRNGITLAYETHDAVERNTLRIVGTVFFEINGVRYINGREPVTFEVIP